MPPPTTLVRGRAEPEEAGRTEADVLLLLAEDEDDVLLEGLAVVEGLLPDEGLPPDEGLLPVDGVLPDEGLAVVDGELVFGAEGLSDAGGGVACATGAPPPLERL